MARLLASGLDWDAVLFHARLHSVAPLLHRHLTAQARWEALPGKVRPELLRLAHRTAYQNRILARENRRLLQALDREGIPTIVPKGIVLVERDYGDVSLRPLIDLVLLVPTDRVRAAADVMRRCSYWRRRIRPVEAAWRWCCPQFAFSRRDEMLVTALLHWEPINWPRLHRFDAAPLFERACPDSVSGAPALILSATDQALFLCLQADNHGLSNREALATIAPDELLFAEWSNNRLVRFVDLFEVLHSRKDEIDWNELVRRARASVVEEAVFTALTLTDALLGPVVPDGVLNQLGPDQMSPVERWARSLAGWVPVPGPGDVAESGREGWTRSHVPARLRVEMVHYGRLFEYLFPSLKRLERCLGLRSRLAAAVVYVPRTLLASGRSIIAFLGTWVGRTLRRVGWWARGLLGAAARAVVPGLGRKEVGSGG